MKKEPVKLVFPKKDKHPILNMYPKPTQIAIRLATLEDRKIQCDEKIKKAKYEKQRVDKEIEVLYQLQKLIELAKGGEHEEGIKTLWDNQDKDQWKIKATGTNRRLEK